MLHIVLRTRRKIKLQLISEICMMLIYGDHGYSKSNFSSRKRIQSYHFRLLAVNMSYKPDLISIVQYQVMHFICTCICVCVFVCVCVCLFVCVCVVLVCVYLYVAQYFSHTILDFICAGIVAHKYPVITVWCVYSTGKNNKFDHQDQSSSAISLKSPNSFFFSPEFDFSTPNDPQYTSFN